jgi:preprotein translocase subunit YajC
MNTIFTAISVAQCAPAAGPQPSGAGGSMMLVGYVVILFALFYVMIFLPQRRKDKERKQLIEATKSGDRIIFGGGLIGTVTNLKDNTLTVKIGEHTKIEILRGSVQRVLGKDEDAKESDA